MRALLLAAGLGTRLRPITDTIPKCMVQIQGKPLLGYWLEMLVDAGIQPILINLHYFADFVLDYLNSVDFSKKISTVYEHSLLGTAGTLRKNRDFFGNEPVMVIHADNLSKFNVDSFMRSHYKRPIGCEITMMTFMTTSPESCGIVEIDARGVVQAFHEKVDSPPSNLANGAVYIIEPCVFDYLEGLDRNFIDFSTDVIPNFIGRINTFENDVYHRDIGTVESYEAACREYPILIDNVNL